MSTIPAPDRKPTGDDTLRDFTADWRLLILMAMALVVGSGGAGAAWALLHLINLATNIAYHGRFSAAPASIDGNTLGWFAIFVPIAGCLMVGLMARRRSAATAYRRRWRPS